MRVDRDDGGIQVMEHREPPRIPLGDRRFDGAIEESKSGFRLRTFDPFRDRRRIDLLRAGLIALAAIAVVALLFYIGSARQSPPFIGCIAQSQYQVAFDQIELVDDLPSWYRGGKREFLSRVRRGVWPHRIDLSARRSARPAGAGVQARPLGGRGAQGHLRARADLSRLEDP